jgi:hypothetical protein
MMKLLRYVFLFIPVFLVTSASFAQMTQEPTSWKYEVKKKSATEYQLIFHLELKPEWHIWSLHPGGDGYEIAPSFTFDKNAQVKLKGKPTEKGKPIIKTITGIDGKVTYYQGKVDYTQNVTVKGKHLKITGKHNYQVCNEQMCLPPRDRDFEFEIK